MVDTSGSLLWLIGAIALVLLVIGTLVARDSKLARAKLSRDNDDQTKQNSIHQTPKNNSSSRKSGDLNVTGQHGIYPIHMSDDMPKISVSNESEMSRLNAAITKVMSEQLSRIADKISFDYKLEDGLEVERDRSVGIKLNLDEALNELETDDWFLMAGLIEGRPSYKYFDDPKIGEGVESVLAQIFEENELPTVSVQLEKWIKFKN